MKELSDLAAPAVIERKPLLEAAIQKQCVDWYKARGEGRWARKFSSLSQRSVPDFLFAQKRLTSSRNFNMTFNVKFATEFKREDCPINKVTGCMSTDAQAEEQEAMRTAGWYVFECNDFEKFKQTVIAYEESLLC